MQGMQKCVYASSLKQISCGICTFDDASVPFLSLCVIKTTAAVKYLLQTEH